MYLWLYRQLLLVYFDTEKNADTWSFSGKFWIYMELFHRFLSALIDDYLWWTYTDIMTSEGRPKPHWREEEVTSHSIFVSRLSVFVYFAVDFSGKGKVVNVS